MWLVEMRNLTTVLQHLKAKTRWLICYRLMERNMFAVLLLFFCLDVKRTQGIKFSKSDMCAFPEKGNFIVRLPTHQAHSVCIHFSISFVIHNHLCFAYFLSVSFLSLSFSLTWQEHTEHLSLSSTQICPLCLTLLSWIQSPVQLCPWGHRQS